jgi:hypothetical protein
MAHLNSNHDFEMRRKSTIDHQARLAAEAIEGADALLITAGAGMGVDSGLPDFRGTQGFWRAYPAIAKLGVSFEEMANPQWFNHDPALAWAFYGHRLNFGDWSWLGRRTEAQQERLSEWLAELEGQCATLAVIELGAGSALPTVRHTSERVVRRLGGRLIRINPREETVPAGHLGLPLGAAEGMRRICDYLGVAPARVP